MFDFSFYELVMFSIIALIVLGPEKLPQAVRTAGRYYAKFRRTVGTLKAEMEAELDLVETRQKMQEELAKIKQAEADMQKEMARLRGSVEKMRRESINEDAAGTKAEIDTKTEPHSQTTKSGFNAHSETEQHSLMADYNRPLKNRWFLLSDFDKAKRLPSAPFLPNLSPTPLLNQALPTNPATSAAQLSSNEVVS